MISFANLDGSGGGNLSMPGVGRGLAFDLSAGRIYWAQGAPTNKISFAYLDGGGVGDLPTGTATVDNPAGLAIDPVARRIYWANNFGSKISFANLDGSGGDDLPTGAATVANPDGVAIDFAARRIYWTNAGGNKVSFASLDGSGGGADLPTGVATVDTPRGPRSTRSPGGFTGPTSTGSHSRAWTEAAPAGTWQPRGPAGRSRSGWRSTPRCEGSTLRTATRFPTRTWMRPAAATTLRRPGERQPRLLPGSGQGPNLTAAPAISGDSKPGSVLSCSQGSWASDLFGANLYQQPQSFTFQWSRGGNDIAGAISNSYTADVPGDYRCTVTASNLAGAGGATPPSEPLVVAPSNDFTLGKLKRNTARGTATLLVHVPGAGELTVGGSGVAPRTSGQVRVTAIAVGPPWQVNITIKPKGRAKKKLATSGKLTLRATVTFTPAGGTANSQTKRVKLLKR